MNRDNNRCKNPRRRLPARGAAVLATIIVLCLATAACVSLNNYKGDAHFKRSQIETIIPGTSSKADVIRLLGTPIAVARRGTSVVFPPAAMRKTGSTTLPGDLFFDMFPVEKQSGNRLVYYYYSVEQQSNSGLFFVEVTRSRYTIDELWVLVDDDTNLVVDYVLKNRDD